MSEVAAAAMISISISHQARDRYKHAGKFIKVIGNTIPCDELVTVVFLGFYVETSLTYIIEKMGEIANLLKFYNKRDIGLQPKLAYFYNSHMAKDEEKKATYSEFIDSIGKLENIQITEKLNKEFPGYAAIYFFRNKIAHGELDEAMKRITAEYKDIKAVEGLREQAKNIVDTLIEYANKSSCSYIWKTVSYENALKNYGWK